MKAICSIVDCQDVAVIRTWCRRHYQRWRKHGDPLRERPTLWERVMWGADRQANGCWVWWGAKTSDGYGCLRVDGRQRRASRVMWELEYGPIPDGLFVCHSCDNRPCVRPEHLFLGTQKDNIQDMLRKGRRPKHWVRKTDPSTDHTLQKGGVASESRTLVFGSTIR